MQSSSKYKNLKKMFTKENELITRLYKFANISQVDMDMFMEEAMEESFKNRAKSKRKITDLYKESLMKLLNSYLRYQISSNNDFSILLNYINQELKTSEIYEECIDNLDKIFSFLSLIEYIPKEETLIELINRSQTLKSILETIISSKKDLISKGNYNISDNKQINKLIKLFCKTFITPRNKETQKNLKQTPKKQEENPKKEIKAEDIDGDIDIKNYENYVNTKEELANYKEKLTADEERDLFIRYSNGEHRCENIIFEMNRKLVRLIASKYKNKGVEFNDLEQEGNLALLLAIRNFDYEKGFRFSTFAFPWIEGQIKKMVFEKSNPIKFTRGINDDRRKITKKSLELTNKLGRKPFPEELAKETQLSVERVNEILSLPQVYSLDEKMSEDSSTTIGELTPDKSFDISAQLDKRQIKENVLYAIENSGLSSRQIEILKLRYGLIDDIEHTQTEIAQSLGVIQVVISREEKKALQKIREHSKVTGLFYTAQESLDLNKNVSYVSRPVKHLWDILGLSEIGTRRLIPNLSQKKKEELTRLFGENLSNKIDLEKLSQEDKKILNELLKALREISIRKHNKNIKTIYNLLQYPKNKVDEAISLLDEEETILLRLKYGENLEKPTYNPNFTEEDEEKFERTTLSKLKFILENLNKYKKYMEIKSKQDCSLYELLSKYTKEEIKEAISRLSDEDKNHLLRIYGIDLNNKAIPTNINEIYQLTKKIETLISKPSLSYSNNEKTLGELLDEDVSIIKGKGEQLSKAVKKFSETERNIFHSKYGKYFMNKAPSRLITYEEHCIIFTTIIPRLKNLLKGNRVSLNNSLQELFPNVPRKLIVKTVESLSDEDKKIVYLKYGNHLENKYGDPELTKEQKIYFHAYIMPRIRRLLNDNNRKPGKSIYNYLKKYSKEKVDTALKQLNEEEIVILKIKCGENLLGTEKSQVYSEDINKKFYQILAKIRRILTKKDNTQSNSKFILTIFPTYTEDEIKDAINRLSNTEKETIYSLFGIDLSEHIKKSSPEGRHFYKFIKPRITSLLENKKLYSLPSLYDYLKDYSKKSVNKAIENLSEQETIILKIKCGEDFSGLTRANTVVKEINEQFYEIIEKIKNTINNSKRKSTSSRKNKKISEIFPSYTLEEIKDAVNRLNSTQKEIVYLKFGENLNESNNDKLSPRQKSYFNSYIKNKIKSLLENKEKKSKNSFYDFFENYSKEKINECIKNLSEQDKELLYRVYTEDLELKQNYEKSKHILIQRNIIKKLQKKLKYDNKFIHEIFENYTIDLIEYVIKNKLSKESKELIHTLFGENLEKPLNACSLSSYQAQSLLKGIIPKTKSILKKEENIRITLKYIQNVFGNSTLEEIKNATERLKPNHKDIVYSKYGNDLTKENQSTETDNIFCKEIMPSITHLLKHPEESSNINLYSYFKNNTKEEVDEAVSKLSIEDKVTITLLDIDDNGTIHNNGSNEIKEFEKRIVPQLQKILSGKITRKKNQSLNDNPVIKRLSYELPKREFDVLLLYINHSNRLTTSQIAKILNMDESEVIQVAQKTLALYKEYINHMINQTMETIDDYSRKLEPQIKID